MSAGGMSRYVGSQFSMQQSCGRLQGLRRRSPTNCPKITGRTLVPKITGRNPVPKITSRNPVPKITGRTLVPKIIGKISVPNTYNRGRFVCVCM